MSLQTESPQKPKPGGETPAAPEKPSRKPRSRRGRVFGITDNSSDNQPTPWTGPPPPPAG